MSNKKLQVFVSSTFEDLKEERQAAVEAILSAGHIPAGMELFTAGDETQMTVIKRWIDDSDVYLLIFGGRYGSVDNASGKSYTQLEYEYALKQGKALFAVVINQPILDKWLKEFGYEKIEKYYTKELEQFRAEVLKGKVVAFWDDAKDIKLTILDTLPEFQYRENLIGWVRGDNAINTGIVAEELARLGKENEELRNKLSQSGLKTLYAGLSYDQLKGLLEKEIVTIGNNKTSIYKFLLEYANKWSIKFHFPSFVVNSLELNYSQNSEMFKAVIQSLCTFKITEAIGEGWLKITEDGHNFYLKALALQNEENKS